MRIGLVGYGKTGQAVGSAIEETAGMECAGIVSSKHLGSLFDIGNKLDAVIDFSHPSNLEMIGKYAEKNHVALILGTTGYGQEQMEMVKALAEKVPVVFTSNFSLGVTIFQQILKQITPVLRDRFDVDLIEKHHKTKLDAPSGTAKMLLAAMEEDKEYCNTCGFEGTVRHGEEIGVHSVRAGSIAGEHTVLFAGEDEILEITHRAGSNRIFASGAILAVKYAVGKPPGLYDMNDVIFGRRRQSPLTPAASA